MAGRDRGAECDLPEIPTEGKVDGAKEREGGSLHFTQSLAFFDSSAILLIESSKCSGARVGARFAR